MIIYWILAAKMKKENCIRCNKDFNIKSMSEIWSFSTYEEPSSIIGFMCKSCLKKEQKEEQEFSKKEEQAFNLMEQGKD